jgi:hypothetical protein
MKEPRIKIFFLLVISLIVFIVLFSNIGQNFNKSISSYDYVVKYYKSLGYYSSSSKNYQKYINSSSSYIAKILKINKLEPLNKSYTDEWVEYIPNLKFPSMLEVIDRSDRIIKRYSYQKDFVEDFRGNITSGTVKSKADYQPDLISIHKVLNEILLFDGYSNYNSNDAISSADLKLKSLGASGVISPITSYSLLSESGYLENDLKTTENGKGLAKFLVKQNVFNELKNYSAKGYKIKIKSGAEIIPMTYKNVYGVVKGKNPSFKPLVIGIYYDGPHLLSNEKFYIPRNYALSSAIMLDCVNVVNKQRLRKPDKTILFAFITGYSKDQNGLKHLIKASPDGSILLINGLGLNDDFSLDYNKLSSNLNSSVDYFLNKFQFTTFSKIKTQDYENNLLIATAKEINSVPLITTPNLNRNSRCEKFVLSLIQDECYNLNLISGNIRQVRIVGRYVRDNSALLSIIAISFLVLVLFLPTKKKVKKDGES